MFKVSHNTTGFTFIELVATMAIAGILVAIAIPSLNSTLTSNRISCYANDFVSALNFARSEAVRRGIQVTVSHNGALTHWESGWTVFVDINEDEVYNPADTLCSTSAIGAPTEDCLLRIYPSLANGYTLTTGNSSYKKAAAYKSTGISYVVVGDTFRLCNGTDMSTSRAIVIDGVGRPHISLPGTAASCP